MKASDAIKAVMKDTKTTQVQLAKLLGYKGQSAVAERLRNDLRISTLSSMARAMGYEVVLQKVKPGRRPEGQMVLEDEEK